MIQSTAWRDLRGRKLKECPLCEECQREGRTVPATEVHHIVPVESVSSVEQMRRMMFNPGNLESICHTCHVEIHRRMFSHTKESVKANQKRITDGFAKRYLE